MQGKRLQLLYIDTVQFGYNLPVVHVCNQLRRHYDIVFLCFDANRRKVNMEGLRTKYVSREGSKLARLLRLIKAAKSEIIAQYDLVLIRYFSGCSLLSLSPRHNIIVDIRTGAIMESKTIRHIMDQIIQWESLRFKNICVISKGLAQKLRLPVGRIHIVPLGGAPCVQRSKTFERLDLLYVGTFTGRRLEETVQGYADFYREYGDQLPLTYSIAGMGHADEEQRILTAIRKTGMCNSVTMLGYVHRDELHRHFGRCNVGVSYVPINEVYDCQPVTKTYEYLLAGMPVIATATSEQRRVVHDTNGVLIQDNAAAFCEGLKRLMVKRTSFSSDAIRQGATMYSWDNVVREHLLPYLAAVTHGGASQ